MDSLINIHAPSYFYNRKKMWLNIAFPSTTGHVCFKVRVKLATALTDTLKLITGFVIT